MILAGSLRRPTGWQGDFVTGLCGGGQGKGQWAGVVEDHLTGLGGSYLPINTYVFQYSKNQCDYIIR